MQLFIPIPKAGPDFKQEVETERLNAEIYKSAIELGLQLLLGARMTGKQFTGMTKMTPTELAAAHAEAQKRVQENLESLYAGELPTKRKTTSKTKGLDQLVVKEALQLAVNKIQDVLRSQHLPVGQYSKSELTAFAKDMIEADPSYIAEAEARVKQRKSMEIPETLRDLLGALQPNPKAVARAEKAKAERAATRAAKGHTKPKASKGIVAAARRPTAPIHVGITH